MTERLKPSELQQIKEDTTSRRTSKKEESLHGDVLCTPESPAESKKTTLSTKSLNSEDVTQTMKFSKTTEVASTSKGKDLRPYWTPSCLEMSEKWLSLTETGSVGSDLNSLSRLQQNTTAESWFSTTLNSPLSKSLFKTSYPSSMSSPAVFTDSGSTIVRSSKRRLYPKPQSRQRMRQYLGLSRYWYNKAVEYLKLPETKASLAEVRRIQKLEHPEWAMDCPQRVREHAMSSAVEAVKAAKKKCKAGQGFQQVSWRSRKDRKQRFGFDKKSLKESFCFSRKKDRVFFQARETFETCLEGTEIVRENGRWFLVLPQRYTVKMPENQRLPMCALDPGVRTFLTLYSPWMTAEFGAGDFGRIHRLCLHLDQLMSRISKAKDKKKSRMRKAAERMRWRIKDFMDDCHKKLAYFLVTRFDTILLPTFETSQMVSKLRSKTARAMLTWAHDRFKQRLKAKAEEYSAEVVDVCEAYTSKTCSYCGHLHKIGSRKRMRCSCGVDVDRDQNGARGILLRALGASPSLHRKMESALESGLVRDC